jgi:predicted RNase H-like HicB family nuclease
MNNIEQLIKEITSKHCELLIINADENGYFFVQNWNNDEELQDGETLEEALENFKKNYCK